MAGTKRTSQVREGASAQDKAKHARWGTRDESVEGCGGEPAVCKHGVSVATCYHCSGTHLKWAASVSFNSRP